MNAVQFDVRYIETNAERFNEPGTDIVKSARILTEALLRFIKLVYFFVYLTLYGCNVERE